MPVVRLKRRRKRCVLVADAPADFVDWRIRALQPAFRILDAQALHLGDRRKARGVREASLERAHGELRAFDRLLHWIGHREVLGQPLLRASTWLPLILRFSARVPQPP